MLVYLDTIKGHAFKSKDLWGKRAQQLLRWPTVAESKSESETVNKGQIPLRYLVRSWFEARHRPAASSAEIWPIT